ncbi:Cellulose synthase catalytic subunit [UDP-forming] [Cytospora mali]|uniref:Cellulose synthase catalytic subunit [UDP-forming] n=1 Tax=Cytospora mali TaxID=578113 RepID=A0A194V0T2_CYTMA|nr:Cellulose synthase catalytic subunit [UDP-forming] [Valsa mali var. pyri (nom. inval.)]
MRPAPSPPTAPPANPFESREYEASQGSRPSTIGIGTSLESSSGESLPVAPEATVPPLSVRDPHRAPPRPARSTDLEITPASGPQVQTNNNEGAINEKSVDPFDSDPEATAGRGVVTTKDKQEAERSQPAATSSKTKTTSRNPFKRVYYCIRRIYCPIEEEPLVLPTAPTDVEKFSYLHTNRIPLYIFGLFSFLSLSAGMWLFSLCATPFYWYGFFVGFLNIYLMISYWVGVVGKDWNYDAHKARVERFPINAETAPTVDIYLPVCAEELEILDNTWKHVTALDWPADKIQVHVLDDGAKDVVRRLAERYGFNYIVRGDRPRLKKAGNLRWAFARTTGDFFAIFDADFCPRPDFLRELMVEQLDDDKIAIVQSPQFFRVTDEQTWVEQGAGATQELFYRVVQVNRDRWGASICVGSNALYRRAALEEVGGTAEIGFSEDVHTGFGAVDRGWKVRYVPLCLATGVCPPTPRSFFSQQMRWARGSTTLLTNGHFWVSNLTFVQKVCYLCGFLYYSAVSLGIFISPVPGILLLWFRPEWFKYYNLAFAIPSIVYGLVVFRFWAKATYSMNVQHIMLIQSYAYLTAIKDRLFGIELLWAASGDAKAHKSNKYRNMRILCWLWTLLVMGGMISAVTWRLTHGFEWYNPIPLIVLNVYNLYVAHRFLLCNW